MANITLIAAIGKNKELGKDNQLIWHLKEDMRFFKEQTMNKKIIMGRKTLESLPKLLPGRTHIVLTKQNIDIPGIIIFHTKEELMNYLYFLKEEVYVIGGASVYQEMIEYASKLLLTEIQATSNADVYFPNFNPNAYTQKIIKEGKENNIKYKILEYKKKK